MSGWSKSLFDSEQVGYDELEIDTSDQGSNLRARATVTLPDGMEVDVDDFDTAAAVQDWSPDSVRSVSRDASDERVLEDLTRLAARISRSPRGKCHRPRRQPR
ncbi:hypothetical protein BH708_01950 [Brachybacterium sp. P6-10-X1]|uniref:hypothetical protein n=1 Tax=Brachybacterium sp. P6-10-X1 TaxID=1903186 RepID=UPI000971B045|nr:hypothetical protein [Brachybacterium sp. P6-10-X1]APX31689.1 hypothetical protein BH708_01950 [Brachybacterium sp. P6-10-X1]